MSEKNVELVRRGIEMMNRRDLDGFCEGFDPEIVWEETPSLGPDAAVYRGIPSVRGAIESWLGMWIEYKNEPRRIEVVGDNVVALMAETARGDSGVTVERQMGAVHSFRDGKIVHARLFGSWDEALEAVGLGPS